MVYRYGEMGIATRYQRKVRIQMEGYNNERYCHSKMERYGEMLAELADTVIITEIDTLSQIQQDMASELTDQTVARIADVLVIYAHMVYTQDATNPIMGTPRVASLLCQLDAASTPTAWFRKTNGQFPGGIPQDVLRFHAFRQRQWRRLHSIVDDLLRGLMPLDTVIEEETNGGSKINMLRGWY
jgi:hypothetical protein